MAVIDITKFLTVSLVMFASEMVLLHSTVISNSKWYSASKIEKINIGVKDKKLKAPFIFLTAMNDELAVNKIDEFIPSGNYCSVRDEPEVRLPWTYCGGKYCKIEAYSWLDLEVELDNYIYPNMDTIWNECESNHGLNISDGSVYYINKTVRYLDLSGNEISNFPNGFFCGLSSLRSLYLGQLAFNDTRNLGFSSSDMCSGYIDCHLDVLNLIDLGRNDFSVVRSGSFCGLNNLKELNMVWCNISVIERSSFASLRNLSKLNLSRNRLAILPNDVFSELTNLRLVNMSYNRLDQIPVNLFANSTQLKTLLMTNNKLSRLPEGIFLNQTYYKSLTSANTSLTFNDSVFYGLWNLETLNVSGNYIRNIPVSFISSLNSLKSLSIASNKLQFLPDDLFNNKTSLIRLELQNNKIRFGKNIFKGCRKLQVLNLANNQLGEIPNGALRYSYKLITLVLSDNNISTLDKNLFDKQTLLVELELQNNSLSFNENIFQKLRKLEYLNLSNNGFVNITNVMFSSLPKLTKLILIENNITFIEKDSFDNLTYLNYLALGKNQLNIQNEVFKNVFKLEYLDLAYNEQEDIPVNLFSSLYNLKTLLLHHNKIRNLPDGLFDSLPQLFKLDLQINQIGFISDAIFAKLTRLVILNLSYNQLKTVESNAFTLLTSLKVFVLSNNQIRNFPLSNLESSTKLTQLDIRANPWSCDCAYVRNNLPYLQKNLQIIKNPDTIYCLTNKNVKTNLLNFNVDQCYDDASENSFTILWGTLLGIVLFMVLIVILGFRFRHEMQVMIYSRYGVRIFSSNKVDNQNKMFDVFISYSCQDEEFLLDKILPGLETSEKPYRLCLHHKDFIPGAFITDSIMEAVQHSAMTLILLSDNFIQSEWCRFEFKMAHIQMMKDRCNRVIVIVIGDEVPNNLDSEMLLYMKTNTYLKFNDKLFWKKLYFALPDQTNRLEPIV
ncbi:defense response [Chamberlinius hualienensis]